jgi:signal peptidase II
VKRSSQLSALGTLFIGILAADQTSKHFARGLLHAIDLGPLLVTYTENRGAFLSFGENLPDHVRAWLFNGVVAVGLIALAIYIIRHPDVPLTLVLAGGFGNLIDRLRFDGRVTDFLYLHAGPLHTGVFNVADMAITAGAIWMLVQWAVESRKRERL